MKYKMCNLCGDKSTFDCDDIDLHLCQRCYDGFF